MLTGSSRSPSRGARSPRCAPGVGVSGSPRDDPELDHDAYLDKQG
ncbi:hypothetical protein BZL29_4408 [Mycobacterium kansasii]|uniref:Uncharacterized protein n=1 Tax=Mycobacterium kansasii TaxID=1768 RepID=A0A1V3X652_MYCKA|nr:hypothetical protein BZL29_4408 [Mycobacterium kansasii]